MQNAFIGIFKYVTFKPNFVMIYMINKMLVSLQSHLNYLNYLECFLRSNRLLFFLKKYIFFKTCNNGKFNS